MILHLDRFCDGVRVAADDDGGGCVGLHNGSFDSLPSLDQIHGALVSVLDRVTELINGLGADPLGNDLGDADISAVVNSTADSVIQNLQFAQCLVDVHGFLVHCVSSCYI